MFVGAADPADEIQMVAIPRCDGYMYAIGDSMTPDFNDGDIVFYKTVSGRRDGLIFGEPYVLVYREDSRQHVVIRYVERSDRPGHYRLISLNPKYEPVEIPVDCIRRMALIKATIRYNNIG